MTTIEEEYQNVLIYKKLNNIEFIDKSERRKVYKLLQHFIENRILYSYYIKKPPYSGYNTFGDDENFLIIKFIKDMQEYAQQNNINDKYINQLKEIINYFKELIKNKQSYPIKPSHVVLTNEFIIYKEIKVNRDQRINYIIDKIGKDKTMVIILRYLSFDINGQHCSLPFDFYKYLYDEFNVRIECFASPFNSKLLELEGTKFCSLFIDTDKYIGSYGPFSYKVLVKNENLGNVLLNPPYMEDVFTYMYKNIKKALKLITRKDYLMFIVTPKWIDSKTYISLKKSKYLMKYIEPVEGKHYMNCNGKMTYMRGVQNCIFVLSPFKNKVDEKKITTLLQIWNNINEGYQHQSNLQNSNIEFFYK